jgi:hypothetical protein
VIGMTIEEKRAKIAEHCKSGRTMCRTCHLLPYLKGDELCYSGDADIERNYAILFGDDGKPEFTKPDNVNHPKHYESGKFECIDVMCEAIGLENTKGFCLCNAFKYIYRCNKKHQSPVEDVKKAIWYLNKFLELEGESHE